MNKLIIMQDPSNADSYIAVYTGETGGGELVADEEAHNLAGESRDDIISSAASVWGIVIEDCEIDFDYCEKK